MVKILTFFFLFVLSQGLVAASPFSGTSLDHYEGPGYSIPAQGLEGPSVAINTEESGFDYCLLSSPSNSVFADSFSLVSFSFSEVFFENSNSRSLRARAPPVSL